LIRTPQASVRENAVGMVFCDEEETIDVENMQFFVEKLPAAQHINIQLWWFYIQFT